MKTTIFMFVFYFGTLHLCCYQPDILHPVHQVSCLAPPACQNLVVFGNPHKLLAEAEEELATLPQLATEEMFITEHYLS